ASAAWLSRNVDHSSPLDLPIKRERRQTLRRRRARAKISGTKPQASPSLFLIEAEADRIGSLGGSGACSSTPLIVRSSKQSALADCLLRLEDRMPLPSKRRLTLNVTARVTRMAGQSLKQGG